MGGIVSGIASILGGGPKAPEIAVPKEVATRRAAVASQKRQTLARGGEAAGSTGIGRKTLLGQ